MKKKIIGIVLIVIAVIVAVVGILAAGKAPGNQEIIQNAVYVADGKVLPENEGKVVIVPGTLAADLPFADKETGIMLDSIVAQRKVEKLSIDEEEKGDEDKKELFAYWSWDSTLNESDYGGSKKLIAPNVTLGEFAVEEELLQSLSVSENRTEYADKKELNQKGWNVFKDGGKVYLYPGAEMPLDDEELLYYTDRDYMGEYEAYVGTLRVSYDVMTGSMEYTVIGLQQNGQLVKAPELDLKAVHAGQLSAEDLLAYAESNASLVTYGTLGAAVVLLAIGVVLLILKEKKPADKKA